jgi:aminopeptidase N
LYGGGLRWQLPGRATVLTLDAKYMLRPDSTDLTYLLYPEQWEPEQWNGIATAQLWDRFDHHGGSMTVALRARSSAVGSGSHFGQISLTAVEEKKLGRLQLRMRLFGQFADGDLPRESALYLAGASPEEMMEDKFVRSIGFVPYDWLGYGAEVNHFQHGGGLNLRGYAGYLAPELVGEENELLFTYVGNSGWAVNGELDVDGLFPIRPRATRRWLHIDAYLFGDVGSITYLNANNNQLLTDPRADAGAGFCFTIKRWWRFSDVKPLTIRFDMPLLLSRLPAAEEDYFGFRYLVAVGRTF